MRNLPAALLDKIQKAFQTKHNNADPRIELIIQRTKRFIEEGTALQPTCRLQKILSPSKNPSA